MKRFPFLLCVLILLWAAPARALLSDSFTDTNGTLLENHTPTQGTAWVKITTKTMSITSNEARVDSGTTWGAYYITPQHSAADYYNQVSAKTGGTASGDKIRIRVRSDTDEQPSYMIHLQGDEGIVRLYHVDAAGTATELGNYTIPGFAGTTYYTLKLQVEGTSLTVYVDGTERISTTDSNISAVGYPVISGKKDNIRIDDFESNVMAAGVRGAAMLILQ